MNKNIMALLHRAAITTTKDVLPNINHMQATEITPSSDGMVPSAAELRYLQQAHYNASCSRKDNSITAGG